MATYGNTDPITMEVVKNALSSIADEMALDGVPADIGFRRRGYLFLSDDGDHATDLAIVHLVFHLRRDLPHTR